ncbi:hypothetical protein HYT01_01560 [Candidatus Giovannonibacteria bacterium]|nr:hypothetical protein [Candidatus Giovannonibacteria bacterium]
MFLFGILALLLSACAGGPLTTREKGGLIGAGAGAAVGGLIGAATGHPAAGALIGGGLGLGAGALTGDHMQGAVAAEEQRQRELEQLRRENERLRQER